MSLEQQKSSPLPKARFLGDAHLDALQVIANHVGEDAAQKVEKLFDGDTNALAGMKEEDVKVIQQIAQSSGVELAPIPDPFAEI